MVIPLNKIRREDVLDSDFIDAIELSSDGYLLYRTSDLLSTTAIGSIITIDPSSSLDLLDFGEQIIESKDRVFIFGTDDGYGDGYYTVNQVIDSFNFTVFETITNSVNGFINFYYPSGASKVGVDQTNLTFTDKTNVQEALEDLSLLVTPTDNGQILYSDDSEELAFRVRKPVAVEPGYFIMDNLGNLIVV